MFEVGRLQEMNDSLYDRLERLQIAAENLEISQRVVVILSSDLEMRDLRVRKQSDQIHLLTSKLEEEKLERERLEGLREDDRALISSLRRKLKEVGDSKDYYKQQRDELLTN